MKSHCRLILILAIAYSLPGLLSYTAQTKAKSADEARAAQINEGSERGSLAGKKFGWQPSFRPSFQPSGITCFERSRLDQVVGDIAAGEHELHRQFYGRSRHRR